jgi:type VI secretion system protein ImpE
MSALAALHRGDLDEALANLKEEIRAQPDAAEKRVFLFQLYAVLGEWERALTQLNVARDLDTDALLMAQTYQEVLRCEVLRLEVFAGKRRPLVLGEPEAWVAQSMEALRLSAAGDYAAAATLREAAWNDAPTTPGQVTVSQGSSPPETIRFDWIADSDMRLGPLLEAIIDGRYYWVPFHRIRQIDIESPTDLRDLVWLPAHFTWTNEGQSAGMIPTRYPGSESHLDAEIRLARRSEWREPAEGMFEGLGQRVLSTDSGDFDLLNIRQIRLDPPPAE